jgi:hypothetical protein
VKAHEIPENIGEIRKPNTRTTVGNKKDREFGVF